MGLSRGEKAALQQALALVRKPVADRPPDLRVVGSPLDHLREVAAKHPVPYEWEQSLRAITPISLTKSWLAFRWVDGTPDATVERWLLYECIPNVPEQMRNFLGGMPWWKLPPDRQVGRRMLVSAYQWEMYRKHQVWARPFWCLQGNDGGTPAVYSTLEKKLLKLDGQPGDPPAYGSLPYAPWDGRSEQRIKEREQLWKLSRALDRMTQQGIAEHLKAETEDAERQFRAKFLAWTRERFAAQADFLTWYTKTAEADRTLRPTTPGEMRAAEQLDEQFITHGTVPYAHDLPSS